MRHIVVVIFSVLICASILSSCEEERQYYVKNVGYGEHVPTSRTTDVNMLISDSGYTKYIATSAIWDVYDMEAVPYWHFPVELKITQLDPNGRIESVMRCDSAIYKPGPKLWQLDGHVVLVNTARDTFLTSQLFWDGAMHKLRSDSFIHIVKDDRIVEGYGFESNEQMTSYVVKRPTGIFPVSRDQAKPSAPTDQAEASDAENDGSGQRNRVNHVRSSEREQRPMLITPNGPMPLGTNRRTDLKPTTPPRPDNTPQ